MLSPAVIGGIVGGIGGGIGGGLAVLAWMLMQSPQTCPDCDTPLPKFRRPENNQQRIRGGLGVSKLQMRHQPKRQ